MLNKKIITTITSLIVILGLINISVYMGHGTLFGLDLPVIAIRLIFIVGGIVGFTIGGFFLAFPIKTLMNGARNQKDSSALVLLPLVSIVVIGISVITIVFGLLMQEVTIEGNCYILPEVGTRRRRVADRYPIEILSNNTDKKLLYAAPNLYYELEANYCGQGKTFKVTYLSHIDKFVSIEEK